MSDLVKRSPDPLRAHGAWVYLGLSVLAGLALALPHEPLASLAIGGATVATFVGAGAIACKKRRKRRLLIAAALLLVSLGSLLGSPLEPRGLAYALPALFLLLVTAGLASSRGFFAPSTLAAVQESLRWRLRPALARAAPRSSRRWCSPVCSCPASPGGAIACARRC
jgi:MFS family permease